jgi:protein SCO1/2
VSSRRDVLVIAGIALLAMSTMGLALWALDRRQQPDGQLAGPAAIVPEQEGPFRGGQLPGEIDRAPAPDFRLPDARGGALDTADLDGRPWVVTFLYTDCPDVCPLIAQELKQALEQLGPRGRDVTVAAVSADPVGDDREAVRRWLEQQRLPRNFRYAIGSERRLEPVWKSYYAAPQEHGNPNSAHSASVWLVDRQGRLRTKFSGGMPVPPRDLAHDLKLLLDEPA